MSTDLNPHVRRWQDGERAAADHVLQEVRRAVLKYALARRLPLHDAEDLVQDVCLAVVAAVPTWQDTGRPFWALVFTIATRRLADRARAGARLPQLVADDAAVDLERCSAPSPEELVLLDEQAEHLSQMLAGLPATQRDVVVLRILVGLSVADTAAALGLARGSVHVLQHRALKKVRATLEGAQ